MGKNVPSREAPKVAVICHLSLSPATSTLLLPLAAMVQSPRWNKLNSSLINVDDQTLRNASELGYTGDLLEKTLFLLPGILHLTS